MSKDVELISSLFQIPWTEGISARESISNFLAGLARTKQTARLRRRKHIPPESPDQAPVEDHPAETDQIDLTNMSGSGSDDDKEGEKEAYASLAEGGIRWSF